MVTTLGHPGFLFVADGKAASQETRATIDRGKGRYLFPLPLTGETPVCLEEQVGQQRAVPILLPQVWDKNGQPKRYGQGVVVPRHCPGVSTAGQAHSWSEQCLVTQSAAHAQRQRQAFTSRLARSEHALNRLRPRQGETREACVQRAHKVLQQQQTTAYFTITIQEKVTEQKRYRPRGRPTPTTPCELVTRTTLALTYARHTETSAAALTRAGWRVYVSNTTAEDMSLTDALGY